MNGKIVEQTRMRAGIARRMAESKRQAPHFYVQTEVAVDGVRDRLATLNEGADTDARVTMTAALFLGCVAALRAQPKFNSIWTPDGLFQADEINVGIAIALDTGSSRPRSSASTASTRARPPPPSATSPNARARRSSGPPRSAERPSRSATSACST